MPKATTRVSSASKQQSTRPSADEISAEWAAQRLEAVLAARLGFDFDDFGSNNTSKKRKRGDIKTSKPKKSRLGRQEEQVAVEAEDGEEEDLVADEASMDSDDNDAQDERERELLVKGKHVIDDMRSDDEEWDDGEDDEEDSEEDDDEGDEEALSLLGALGSGSKNANKPSSNGAAPVVVVFNDTSSTRKETSGNASDWRAFMSDKVKLVAGERPKPRISKKEAEQDAEDDQNDRDLMDLLKTTKLVEQYTADELVGKDRRKYNQQKVVELGGKAPKPQKAPLPMRIGFKMGLERIAQKRLQEAKDMGMYHSSLKTQIMGDTARAAKEAEQTKRKMARRDRGIDGGFGKFKDGALIVSKKEIESVEKGPKRFKIGAGGGGSSRSSGGGGRGGKKGKKGGKKGRR
ncbi:hypothetical protein HDV00_007764 [Rhizophlyctis rosea]|nr:hypothetical protein HDV00_007764 [Rhizophlyctis rosea]